MSEFWMFALTILIGAAWLLSAPFLLRKADRATLRAGLWMNGISGKEAEKVLDWRDRQ